MTIATVTDNIAISNGSSARYDALVLSDGEQPRLQRFLEARAAAFANNYIRDALAEINSIIGSSLGLPGDEGIREAIRTRRENMAIAQANDNQNNALAYVELKEYLRGTIEGDTSHPKYAKILDLINNGTLVKRGARYFMEGSGGRMAFEFV